MCALSVDLTALLGPSPDMFIVLNTSSLLSFH
jgi:hypothetical protein